MGRELQAVGAEIKSTDVVISVGDVSEPADVHKVIANTIGTFGKIDVLVNNAAIAVFQPIADLAIEDWSQQPQIDVTGPFLMTKGSRSTSQRRPCGLMLLPRAWLPPMCDFSCAKMQALWRSSPIVCR